MSRTGSIDARNASSGFMLLEMVLALTILLVLFAVVWPKFGNGTNNAQQVAVAYDIATLLRTDRSLATRDNRQTATRIDLAARTVTGAAGRSILIPRDLDVEVTTARECTEGGQRFIIVFAPSGGSCGGVILLKKKGRAYAVRINWLSGMIDVVQMPKA
jgi:general secretion pathway protein H